MGLVAPLLAPEVDRRVARVVVVPPLLVLAHEALLARPRLDQRPVHREVLRGHQPLRLGLRQHRLEEVLGDLAREQPFPILGEHRGAEHLLVQLQAHEPAVQQVVVDLLDQLALAPDRVQHLQQQRPKQLLRRDRRPTDPFRVDTIEAARQLLERRVHQSPDRSKRMVLRNPGLQRYVAEYPTLERLRSSHTSPLGLPSRYPSRNSFSAAC